MLLDEELALKKFAPLVNFQKASDTRVSNDKFNSATTEERGTIFFEQITSTINITARKASWGHCSTI